MNQVVLNLARVWRPKNFETIVGQELVIRMLKNSLYRGQVFPVYLLCGQRGCGKTTTARIFAAAVNCDQLQTFQQDPKNKIVPCLTCISCKAMTTGAHPDFIEIDAASHTGVDNVRQIIDAASFLPLMGTKKVYLIDEAHMLSKAAFNAFLKILEEPPASVLFLLATTDPHKIIETVRSRCFQLFFAPLSYQQLADHLAIVCAAENIAYEPAALLVLAHEAEGSVRDALNLLEQVRCAWPTVSYQAVLTALGRLSDDHLLKIMQAIVQPSAAQLLTTLAELQLSSYAPERVLYDSAELLRALLWVKYGVPTQSRFNTTNLEPLAATIDVRVLTRMFELLCSYELSMARTTKKQLVLEYLFLKMQEIASTTSSIKSVLETPSSPSLEQASAQRERIFAQPASQLKQSEPKPAFAQSEQTSAQSEQSPVPPGQSPTQQETTVVVQTMPPDQWTLLLQAVKELDDPLLMSIFTQASLASVEQEVVTINLPEQCSFFDEWLKETHQVWHKPFTKIFGEQAVLKTVFTLKNVTVAVSSPRPVMKPVMKNGSAVTSTAYTTKPINGNGQPSRFTRVTKKAPLEMKVDVSDAAQWKKANLLLSHFPGTITEFKEQHEEA